LRTSLLVLVRWHGDIVAAHTVEQGRKVESFHFLEGFQAADVGVEVYDVTPEREALTRLRPKRDLRAAYGFVASTALHLGLGLGMALMLLLTRSGEGRLEAPDANRRAAIVEADATQVAANEGADAGAIEPPKNQNLPPEPPQPDPIPLAVAVPPIEDAIGDDTPVPIEKPHAASSASSSRAPVGDPTPVAPESGSESPGSGGLDETTSAPATCVHGKVPKNAGPICTRTVVVTSLDVPPGCFTDTVMQLGQTGTLSFPCDGDGPAKLAFGGKSFSGATMGGKLDMCAGTEYPFSDGCRWTSAQRVTGRVAAQSLSFSYGEAPKAGQFKQCARACSASGTVRVK
jgi:hypothetical protein